MKSQTFGLGQINFGAIGEISADLLAPIFVLWVPVPVFHYSTIISTKKLSLYIHIPNIYLGLGFEPQRIRILAFVSVVRAADDMMEPNIFDYYLFQLQKFYPEQKIKLFFKCWKVFLIFLLHWSPLQFLMFDFSLVPRFLDSFNAYKTYLRKKLKPNFPWC